MEFVGEILYAFMDALREMESCEYPLYVPPRVAGELVQMRYVVAPRRMGRHDWTSGPPPNSDQTMQDGHQALPRIIDNDYGRSVRQRADPEAAADEEVKLADGTILDPPGRMRLYWRHRCGRPVDVPVSAPTVSRHRVQKILATPWSFLKSRHPHARAPRVRMENS